MLEAELCCLQYCVHARRSRTPCKTIRSLQEFLPWWHAHDWAKKPFPGTNSWSECALREPWRRQGDVQTRWAAVHNPQCRCRVCPTEKRKMAVPILDGCSGQLMSAKWISKTSAELLFLSVGSTRPNEPFKTWSWIQCAHWDASTTAAHGEMVQLVGIQNESRSACFKTSSKPKSQSCIVSWHMSRVLTAPSPLFL